MTLTLILMFFLVSFYTRFGHLFLLSGKTKIFGNFYIFSLVFLESCFGSPEPYWFDRMKYILQIFFWIFARYHLLVPFKTVGFLLFLFSIVFFHSEIRIPNSFYVFYNYFPIWSLEIIFKLAFNSKTPAGHQSEWAHCLRQWVYQNN